MQTLRNTHRIAANVILAVGCNWQAPSEHRSTEDNSGAYAITSRVILILVEYA